MKKWILNLFVSFFALCFLCGCQIRPEDIPITRKKPNNFYYTNLTANSLIKDSSIKGSLYELNLHKEKELNKEGFDSVITFFKALSSKNFINKPSDLPQKPEFKMYLSSKDQKFVINIYNEKYITIHPWDGVYSEDYIDISNINARYNLYELCKYFYR
jgi:hypothetical protein